MCRREGTPSMEAEETGDGSSSQTVTLSRRILKCVTDAYGVICIYKIISGAKTHIFFFF